MRVLSSREAAPKPASRKNTFLARQSGTFGEGAEEALFTSQGQIFLNFREYLVRVQGEGCCVKVGENRDVSNGRIRGRTAGQGLSENCCLAALSGSLRCFCYSSGVRKSQIGMANNDDKVVKIILLGDSAVGKSK